MHYAPHPDLRQGRPRTPHSALRTPHCSLFPAPPDLRQGRLPPVHCSRTASTRHHPLPPKVYHRRPIPTPTHSRGILVLRLQADDPFSGFVLHQYSFDDDLTLGHEDVVISIDRDGVGLDDDRAGVHAA